MLLDAQVVPDNHRYIGVGCGLLLGDAQCAPYEGGPLERVLWWLIGSTKGKRRFTDDTQMALDLGNHLLKTGQIDQQSLLQEFAMSYRWSRGYGPSTVSVFKAAKMGVDWHVAATHRHRDGSYGNGAAMRIPVLSVFLHGRVSTDNLLSWVKRSAEVTHQNQLAIDGAAAVAISVCNALDDLGISENIASVTKLMHTPEMRARIQTVAEWLTQGVAPSASQAKISLGAGTAAIESCPLAIYLALKGVDRPFEDLIHNSIAGGGDTDTIGAMAGAIWGAYNGDAELPTTMVQSTEGVDLMTQLIINLRDRHPTIR